MNDSSKISGFVCGGLALALCGCSSSDSGAAGPSHGSSADAGNEGSASGLKLSWAVSDGAASVPDGGTLPGLAGVKVCVDGHAEFGCKTTGADGSFEFTGLPETTDFVFTFEKSGYYSELKAIETASTDMTSTAMIFMFPSNATLPDGVTLDPALGTVAFFAIGPVPGSTDQNAFQTEPGVAPTISPVKGKGPFFYDSKGKYQKTATTSLDGYGFYENVPPGDYTITFDKAGLSCAPISFPFGGWGYPSPPNGVKFPVRAGFLTDEVGVFCTASGSSTQDAGTSADA